MLAGEIDVYAEYTGTAISNYFGDLPWVDQERILQYSNNPTASYEIVSSLDAAAYDSCVRPR